MSFLFRYLSPKSLGTMVLVDNTTTVPVYTDPPSPPPSVPEPPSTFSLPGGLISVANLRITPDSNQRTKNQFRPRLGKGGATSYQLRQYAEVTLGGGSLRKVVKLPEGEDENEWLAVNSKFLQPTRREPSQSLTLCAVVDFYNQINLLYGAITEFCSPQSCPEMKATDEYDMANY